jgi:hypothetical protein
MILKDIGDTCIDCRESTGWGSGRFVNRMPADDGLEAGYLCAECAEADFEEVEE